MCPAHGKCKITDSNVSIERLDVRGSESVTFVRHNLLNVISYNVSILLFHL